MAQILPLPEQYHRLLWQAIPCGLDKIKLANSGTTWSYKSRETFQLFIEGKEALVKIKRPIGEVAAEVELYTGLQRRERIGDMRKTLINTGQAAEVAVDIDAC